MIIILGLLVLIAAVVVGVAGVAANTGEVRTDTSDFGVFDYHFTASAGELFLYGMAVGAIGMLGLALLLAGLWKSSRRNSETRRELRRTRKEAAQARRADDAAVRDATPPKSPEQPKQPPKQPIPATATTEQKPVWSLNRFLPKAGSDTTQSSRRPTADASAK
ncbi:hypothetical protein [Nocardia bovistercoris]|uniref:LapA family protein n=1 Tax=Nocardia bovistercoris TaxID=2785916 RepID=A0A931I9L7_9NOCA|nr:hypothetical protein [Nocardia bovistercoris]MBH0776891.1 hypothetical protein [Nocardia bovistercoris]